MNKKNLKLGGILLALILIAYLWQGPFKSWQENRGKTENFLAGLNVDTVSKIEILQGDNSTTVEKVGDKWKIGGTSMFYIKDNVMSGVITAIKDAVKSNVEIAGANIENKSEFETDENGALVRLSQGEQLIAEFIVGKQGSDFSSGYISRPDSSTTYKIGVNLKSSLVRSDWYDRSIFESERDKIAKIRFQYPTREFTIEREITVNEAEEPAEGEEPVEPEVIIGDWAGTLPYTFKVVQEKIDPILNIMSNLTATEVPEQKFDGTGIEKNLIIIQATGEGIDNTLMVGEARKAAGEDESPDEVMDEDNQGGLLYYVKRGDSDNIYLITGEQRDELDKQIRDLR